MGAGWLMVVGWSWQPPPHLSLHQARDHLHSVRAVARHGLRGSSGWPFGRKRAGLLLLCLGHANVTVWFFSCARGRKGGGFRGPVAPRKERAMIRVRVMRSRLGARRARVPNVALLLFFFFFFFFFFFRNARSLFFPSHIIFLARLLRVSSCSRRPAQLQHQAFQPLSISTHAHTLLEEECACSTQTHARSPPVADGRSSPARCSSSSQRTRAPPAPINGWPGSTGDARD